MRFDHLAEPVSLQCPLKLIQDPLTLGQPRCLGGGRCGLLNLKVIVWVVCLQEGQDFIYKGMIYVCYL
jgi:hypothetical protein